MFRTVLTLKVSPRCTPKLTVPSAPTQPSNLHQRRPSTRSDGPGHESATLNVGTVSHRKKHPTSGPLLPRNKCSVSTCNDLWYECNTHLYCLLRAGYKHMGFKKILLPSIMFHSRTFLYNTRHIYYRKVHAG